VEKFRASGKGILCSVNCVRISYVLLILK
jgi:hypothetical protein